MHGVDYTDSLMNDSILCYV